MNKKADKAINDLMDCIRECARYAAEQYATSREEFLRNKEVADLVAYGILSLLDGVAGETPGYRLLRDRDGLEINADVMLHECFREPQGDGESVLDVLDVLAAAIGKET